VGLVGGKLTLDGRACGGAEVIAVSLTLADPRTAVTATRPDGSFQFPVILPPGEYVVKVNAAKVPPRYKELATSGLRFRVGGNPAEVKLAMTTE
jgi:hypothetical protein